VFQDFPKLAAPQNPAAALIKKRKRTAYFQPDYICGPDNPKWPGSRGSGSGRAAIVELKVAPKRRQQLPLPLHTSNSNSNVQHCKRQPATCNLQHGPNVCYKSRQSNAFCSHLSYLHKCRCPPKRKHTRCEEKAQDPEPRTQNPDPPENEKAR